MAEMNARPLFRLSRSYGAQVEDGAWLSTKNRIWLGIALAVGFLVRVNQLGAQSLWNDEGTSAALARLSLPAIVNAAAQDIHPPLYYILLHFWVMLAGTSEFALRFLSVIAGVVLIALTFRLARQFFDEDVALIAAVLSALNPFQVYYAQETRMYIWVALFAAISVWALVRMFRPPRAGEHFGPAARRGRTLALVLYLASTLAALYTNYYAFTLLLVENLAFVAWLIWAYRARRPRLGHSIAFWIIAQLVVALAYVPWLLFARASLTAWPGISEPLSLVDLAWRVQSAFVTASDTPLDDQLALVAVYTIFFIGGLLPSRDLFRASGWGIATFALWSALPALAMFVVSLARPAYNPKFLLLATPAYLILVARGVSVLYPGLFLRERAPYFPFAGPLPARVARQLIAVFKLFVAALFAAGTVVAVQSLASDPRLERADYRGILAYIAAIAMSRDAVVVDAPGQLDVVRYYARGPAELVTLPVGRPLNEDATRGAIADLVARHNRLFAIYWAADQADPAHLVERSLSEVAYEAADDWHGDVRLAQYAVPHGAEATAAVFEFGSEISLRRVALGRGPLAGGDILPIEFVWTAVTPPEANYKVFVHLVDLAGRIVAQHDGEPQGGFRPTAGWAPAEEISDKLGLVIPVGTPPGTYSLLVGLYRPETGERLLLPNGNDHVELGALAVVKRPIARAAALARSPLHADFDALEAFGYNLDRSAFARGEFIPLVLYWQARAKPSNFPPLEVRLLDSNNHVIAFAPVSAAYPPAQWDAGEIVRDVQSLVIPAEALPGVYHLAVTDGRQSFDIASVRIR